MRSKIILADAMGELEAAGDDEAPEEEEVILWSAKMMHANFMKKLVRFLSRHIYSMNQN